jgi:DNA transposition AAA+ family ATPase
MIENEIQKGFDADARQVEFHVPDINDSAVLLAWICEVRSFIAVSGILQRQLADWCGYSKGAISSILAGRYKGNLRAAVEKLTGVLNDIARKQRRVSGAFVDTTVALRIKTLITQTIAFSDEEGRIGLIIGDGGHGKSACLREYANTNRNAIYVSCDGLIKNLFVEIAEKVGADSDGTLNSIYAQIAKILHGRHIVVLIDECSSLRAKDLDRLRQVIAVKSRCPLILAGNADLLKTIRDESGRRGYASLDQFNSRLTAILNLDDLAGSGGGDGLYTAEDIRKLYEYGGIKLTTDAVDTLRRICKTPKSGRLRTCKHIISALHLATVVRDRGFINSDLIFSAVEQLGLPVRDWLPFVCFDDKKERSRAAATA